MVPLKQHIIQSLCLFYHTRQIKKYVCSPSMNFTVKEFKVDASELKFRGSNSAGLTECRSSLLCLFLCLNESSSFKFKKMVRPVKGNGAVGICVIHLQSISIWLLPASHSCSIFQSIHNG